MVWCFWCDTQSKSLWIPPLSVPTHFSISRGLNCFFCFLVIRLHTAQGPPWLYADSFYFLLSFLFSCFKVGLGAIPILVAFRVRYPPHPLPVSLSLAKFKFIIFGQGPNSVFFNSVFHSHPQRLIVWHIRTSNLSILFLFFRCKGTPSPEEGVRLVPPKRHIIR